MKRAKLFSAAAALAVLPMTCEPLPQQEVQVRVANRWTGPCAILVPIHMEITYAEANGIVVWYTPTGAVFGYSRYTDSHLYKTTDCLDRSPAY